MVLWFPSIQLDVFVSWLSHHESCLLSLLMDFLSCRKCIVPLQAAEVQFIARYKQTVIRPSGLVQLPHTEALQLLFRIFALFLSACSLSAEDWTRLGKYGLWELLRSPTSLPCPLAQPPAVTQHTSQCDRWSRAAFHTTNVQSCPNDPMKAI